MSNFSTLGLWRAAELVAADGRHKTLHAAQALIEMAWRFGALSIIGDRPWITIGGSGALAETIFPDHGLVLRWRGEPSSAADTGQYHVEAIYLTPRDGVTSYRHLRMSSDDANDLSTKFQEWTQTPSDRRPRLASVWWVRQGIGCLLNQPSEVERYWFPVVAPIPLIARIAEAQGISSPDAADILEGTVKEIAAASGVSDDDRRFLTGLSGKIATDDELSRLDGIVRAVLTRELDGDANSRLRALRLFDPDLESTTSGHHAAEALARQACAEPFVPVLPNAVETDVETSANAEPMAKVARGRPKGSIKYPGEESIIAEGIRMVLSGEVTSPTAAADILSAQGAKGNSQPSTRDRLRKKIKAALDLTHPGWRKILAA
jgi:hypothetical protein